LAEADEDALAVRDLPGGRRDALVASGPINCAAVALRALDTSSPM
jgi:hypothetical protein